MSFFDSEIVRAEMAEVSELQEEVYSNVMNFHYMNDVSVSDFEVSLLSSAGRPLKINECGHFSLVLMFETISHDEISAEFIKQYNDEGYALAHKKDYVRI